MPAVLRKDQHELMLPDESLSFVFGTLDTGYLTTRQPVYSSGDPRDGDVERVREDGIDFGEDFLSGKSATYEIGVDTIDTSNPGVDRERTNSDALNRIERVWKHPRFRRLGGYGILRSNVAGRVSRAYGRPRRYDEVAGDLTNRGYTPVVCDFVIGDGRWYAEDPSAVTASLLPPNDGGFVAPIVTPLTTVESSQTSAAMNVGGDTSTWPVVRFHFPQGAQDPRLNFGDEFSVGFEGTVPAGTITVDPRPWVRTVLGPNGASFGGQLSWATPRMADMHIDPGTYGLEFVAIDQSGSSWVEVEWRNAYQRP